MPPLNFFNDGNGYTNLIMFIPLFPRWVVAVYGKVYLRAWRLSSGPYLDHIETHCIQDLMYLCVHAPRGGGGGGGGFFILRNVS